MRFPFWNSLSKVCENHWISLLILPYLSLIIFELGPWAISSTCNSWMRIKKPSRAERQICIQNVCLYNQVIFQRYCTKITRFLWRHILFSHRYMFFWGFIFIYCLKVTWNASLENKMLSKHLNTDTCMVPFFCPLHARHIMSTCNIIMLTCDLSMLACNIIMFTCRKLT